MDTRWLAHHCHEKGKKGGNLEAVESKQGDNY